jgi:NAD(P)H-dependent FMN reductase
MMRSAAESKPLLYVVIASTRPGRVGLPVGEWTECVARAHGGFDVEVVDLAEVNLPFMNEASHPAMRQYEHQHTRDWSRRIDAADAFIFVTPEYNNGVAAPLKNALDYLYFEWHYKPVGFVSYGGVAAGTRGVQTLKQGLDALRLIPVSDSVFIPFIQELLDERRVFAANEMTVSSAGRMLEELVRLEHALRGLRQEVRGAVAVP